MKGYKAFNNDLTCRDFQYEIGQVYEIDEVPVVCQIGFHFCKNIQDVYNFYDMNNNTRVCEIEALVDIVSTPDNTKFCTNKIKIVREITEEWIRRGNANHTSTGFCNTGDWNTGDGNSGDFNSGNKNSGNYNTGDLNIGSYNTSFHNIGDHNTGDWNAGTNNTGSCNIGNANCGENNVGNWNTGNRNLGSYNTGIYNKGNYNSGDFNTGNNSTGCFNTIIQDYIYMFNKLSCWKFIDWVNSDAYQILKNMPINHMEWVFPSAMTDEEKEENPNYKTTNGYLKVITPSDEIIQSWWKGLHKQEKESILSLPNFDPQIFKECTGIDVSK